MNTMKNAVKVVMAAGLMVLGLGLVKEAQAGTNDTMKVYVTPSAGSLSYAVTITSPEVQGYDFSSVALGATTISTLAIEVTNSGTVGEYFAMAISNTSPDNWAAVPTGTPGYNQFKMLGHFVNHAAGQPVDSTFDVNVDTMTSTYNYGTGNFGQTGLTSPGASNRKDLWLRLTMPQTVATGLQQAMTLTINGQTN